MDILPPITLILHTIKKTIIIIFTIYFFMATIISGLNTKYHQQFSLLAQSFLQGKLHLLQLQPYTDDVDTLYINGKYYWLLTPFPAILLMPFVAIANAGNFFFYQGYLHIIIVITTFILCYKIGRLHQFSKTDSLYLAFFFCFATTYIGIAFYSLSWYFSHAIAVALLLTALYIYLTTKKWLYIGLAIAALFATRFTSGFAIIFFLLEIIRSKEENTKKLLKITALTVPVVITGILLLYYNYIRFGNIFDNGYMQAKQPNKIMEETRKRYGLFKIDNIITNIYFYFLLPPIPVFEPGTYHLTPPYLVKNAQGLSFFITSPLFIIIFTKKPQTTSEQNLWIASIVILTMLLMYVFNGASQYGTRYILDLLPLWYIILLRKIKQSQLNYKHLIIITTSAITNGHFFYTRIE